MEEVNTSCSSVRRPRHKSESTQTNPPRLTTHPPQGPPQTPVWTVGLPPGAQTQIHKETFITSVTASGFRAENMEKTGNLGKSRKECLSFLLKNVFNQLMIGALIISRAIMGHFSGNNLKSICATLFLISPRLVVIIVLHHAEQKVICSGGNHSIIATFQHHAVQEICVGPLLESSKRSQWYLKRYLVLFRAVSEKKVNKLVSCLIL